MVRILRGEVVWADLNPKYLRSLATPTLPPVWPWLGAHDEQQVDGLDGIIRPCHGNRSPALGDGELVWMLDGKSPAVSQVDVKWLERPGAMSLPELLGG